MPETVEIREIQITVSGRPAIAPAQIQGAHDVARFVRDLIGDELREFLVAIFLDGRNRPIGYRIVSIGTQTASLVHPREVFQGAVGAAAVTLVVAHNHPSGDPRPSPEDLDVTARLAVAGRILGIQVLDHVVVGHSSETSIRETNPDLFVGE